MNDDTQPQVCWLAVLLAPVAPLMAADHWLAAVGLLVLALVAMALGDEIPKETPHDPAGGNV